MRNFTLLTVLISLLLMVACQEKDNPVPAKTGKISFQFNHLFNDQIVIFDTLQYINEAGNHLLFSEIQYFISDVTLYYADGSTYLINKWKDIHYVDSDIPSTLTWDVFDSIPVGRIDSINFTFGINEEKNQSYMYVNPPESLMFWPDILGGGYHYMKLNGKWVNEDQQLSPFNFHLGIGQTYDSTGQVSGFIHNDFNVNISLQIYSSFMMIVNPNDTTRLGLFMNIESWFRTPNTWDFNYWGGDIMQNQEAMFQACENGHDIFRVGSQLNSQE